MKRFIFLSAIFVALSIGSVANAQDGFFHDAAKKCYAMNQNFTFEKDGFEIWIPNGGKATACVTEYGIFIEFNRWEGMQSTIEFLTLFPTPVPIQTIYGGAIFEGAEIVSHQRIGTSHFGFANVLNNGDTVDICRKRSTFRLIETIFGPCQESSITQEFYPTPNAVEDDIVKAEIVSLKKPLRFLPSLQMGLMATLYQGSQPKF